MRLLTLGVGRTRRFLPLLAALVFVAALAVPAAAQATGTPSSTWPFLVAQEETTSSTTAAGQTTESLTPASGTTGEAGAAGQAAIVPPPAGEPPLNPGWRTDQMDVRILPEFDQRAVLVIVGFALPADVALPATLKFPIPAGAVIAGIGEVSPSGSFVYNYADSYPEVEPGTEWDIATIEVRDYRELQIDYYYDPGLPQDAGQRSFPILAQAPMDTGMLLLHVQEPARATDFTIQPALQGSGQADDGFTYSVATYSEVACGSALGHLVSYYKPDGGLSIDSGGSQPTEFNTNTVLLAAILVIVVIVGALVVYRLYFGSRGGKRPSGRSGTGRGAAGAAPAVGTKRQRQQQAAKASKGKGSKGAATKGAGSKGAATKGAGPKSTEAAEPEVMAEPEATESETPEPETGADSAEVPSDEAVEYCVACGEELTADSPFCPSCGEARP